MAAPRVLASELAEFLQSAGLALDDAGTPQTPLVVVQLSPHSAGLDAEAVAAARGTAVLVGVAGDGADPATAAALDLTLAAARPAASSFVAVEDIEATLSMIEAVAEAHPRSVATLAGLLRATPTLSPMSGLVAESLAYSTLLAGSEFSQWRAARPMRATPAGPAEPAVLVRRDGTVLDIRLNRADRHNAFDRFMRDGLVEAFDLATADRSITRIRLAGNGPSFCSGGDLDEFGATPDVSTAHLIRLDRSVAARVHRVRAKTSVLLHGACIGAGIEIASFAAHIDARPETFLQLPEISMGLVPGAGGTVGIARRIGRWRTAFLALTGQRIYPDVALEWGLIDAWSYD